MCIRDSPTSLTKSYADDVAMGDNGWRRHDGPVPPPLAGFLAPGAVDTGQHGLTKGVVVEHTGLPTRLEMIRDFVSVGRPAVFRRALADWQAITAWTPQYLRRVFGNATVKAGQLPYGYSSGRSSSMPTFAAFLDSMMATCPDKAALERALAHGTLSAPPYLFDNNVLNDFDLLE